MEKEKETTHGQSDGYKRCVECIVCCLRPYTRECTRTRPAHGSQARDGLVSTGEGDHPGILDAVDIHFFFSFFSVGEHLSITKGKALLR